MNAAEVREKWVALADATKCQETKRQNKRGRGNADEEAPRRV